MSGAIARNQAIPKPFIKRRLHSLMGFWLTIFLMEHLLTNSQAALLFGENGQGFVHAVNAIHNIPYLKVVEVLLFAIPIGFHAFYGVKYALQAKSNVTHSDGEKPSLPEYTRNRAYTWQRITSWILLVMLSLHVVKFRFIEYPSHANMGNRSSYFVKVSLDNGLESVTSRLGAKVYTPDQIYELKTSFYSNEGKLALDKAALIHQEAKSSIDLGGNEPYNPELAKELDWANDLELMGEWIAALTKRAVSGNDAIIETPDFGTATLFTVRETFKSFPYAVAYTIFVLAACFHAFNGFWSFLISWGAVIRVTSQKKAGKIALFLMVVVTLLGLSTVWGTYWVNLRY